MQESYYGCAGVLLNISHSTLGLGVFDPAVFVVDPTLPSILIHPTFVHVIRSWPYITSSLDINISRAFPRLRFDQRLLDHPHSIQSRASRSRNIDPSVKMYISSNSLLSTGLVALRMVSASPLPSTHIVPRQSVDCEDPNETPDPSCWAILGVSNYVTNWTTTARTCPGTVDDAMCCAEGELWANCFIRLAMGPSNGTPTSSSDGNIHCDEIGTSACPSDFYIYIEDQDNSVKARYVVIAIQCKS